MIKLANVSIVCGHPQGTFCSPGQQVLLINLTKGDIF